MNDNKTMAERDLNVLWHPCTQMKDHETIPLVPVRKGEGVYLEDFDGNRYIDAISSWWVNLFGHSNAYINAKVTEQLGNLEHVILAGFTHEPVIRLSERLVKLTPEGLTRCFYADNGSSAIEVALKMSYHAHKNQGLEKSLFISLSNSYHGETLGALAVGDVALYKETYQPLLIKAVQTTVPADQSIEEADKALNDLKELLDAKSSEVAAMIVEPLVQGAGGMMMYHPSFLTGAKKLCEHYNVHFIADEVLVGFGRTGTLFACEQAQITPDFIVLSKGLTGGYLPLSVVVTTEQIYGTFYCDYNPSRSFLHSHSYTGNALACAAANATLDIFEQDNVIEKNQRLIDHMAVKLKDFEGMKHVKGTRQCGMIAVVELEGFSFEERVGLKIHRQCMEEGVLIRPLGSVIYVMPPYVISLDELDRVFDAIKNAIDKL